MSENRPALLSPRAGSAVSDIAVHFLWTICPGARQYQIHYDRSPGFAAGICQLVWNTIEYLNAKEPHLYAHLPDDPLTEGTWYWRVRAVVPGGMFGPWSDTGSFSVKPVGSAKPLGIEVSAAHPLIVLYSARITTENWRTIPESLKPYTALRVEETPDRIASLCEEAEKSGVPLLLQLAGPHDARDGAYWRIPLSDVEHFFQTYPSVKGVTVVEQACQGGLASPVVTTYLERLLPLAASYGKLVVWADGHWYGNHLWTELLEHEVLYRAMQKHSSYIVPTWKMNCAWTPHMIQSSIFGLWLGGAAERWGVEMESWYWNEAGFTTLDRQAGFKDGGITDCPPSFIAIMAVLGLTAGAALYVVEPDSDVWSAPGRTCKTWDETLLPFFTQVIERHLIPEGRTVREQVKVAYQVEKADTRWLPEFGGGLPFFEPAYGKRHPFQMIPATGRYYWIPAISRYAAKDRLRAFKKMMRRGAPSSERETKTLLDSLYPEQGSGTAWRVRVGDLLVIVHSHENRNETQPFSMDLSGKFASISGTCEVNGFLIVKRIDDRTLWFMTGGRSDRAITITVTARPGARVEAAVQSLVSLAKGEGGSSATFTVSHAGGVSSGTIGAD